MVAALIFPEFSVGAGELARRDSCDDPAEPAAKQRLGRVKPGQAAVRPQLAGVRYAALVELDPEPDFTAAALRAALPVTPPGTRILTDSVPDSVMTASLPDRRDDASAMAPASPDPVLASIPVDQVAAVAVAAAVAVEIAPVMAPAALPAVEDAPSLPRDDDAGVAATVPVSVALPAAAAAAPAAVAAPAEPMSPAPAAGGMIEQLTPARIALAQSGPSPAPRQDLTAPGIKPPAATKVTGGAPGTRPPAGLVAPAAKPATVAAPPAARSAASAPVPVQPAVALAPVSAPVSAVAPVSALAIAIPRHGNPASAASLPAMPEITARLLTRVDGKTAGEVDFQQTPAGLKVRLGSIVEVLADRYDPAQIARIRTSAAGQAYLSLAELQAQGVPISYDPVYDEFNVGLIDTRPKAARKVHMDQISAPERGPGVTGMEQVRR